MITHNNKNIKSIEFGGGGSVSKVMLQDKQVFPEKQVTPPGPTYPISIGISASIGFSTSRDDFFDHDPYYVTFNTGESWTLTTKNSSYGIQCGSLDEYEDGTVEITDYDSSYESMSVTSFTDCNGDAVSYSFSKINSLHWDDELGIYQGPTYTLSM